MLRVFSIFVAIIVTFPSFYPAGAQDVGESGRPLPRFVSIATDKSYMRTGPGRQYPISWTYTRKNLPVKVVDEYGPWRRVVDFEGTYGWIYRSLLSPRRTAMIVGGSQVLRSEPTLSGKINANLQEGVIVDLLECGVKWCKLQHPQVTGWLPRAGIFGVLENEVFD